VLSLEISISMVEMWLPYGKSEVHLTVPINDLAGVIKPNPSPRVQEPKQEITRSLEKNLELIGFKPDSRVAIAVDGLMEPNLAVTAVSALVEKLSGSISKEGIVIVIGSGFREKGNPELRRMIQSNIELGSITVEEHLPSSENVVNVGQIGGKTDVEINHRYASSEIKISIGEFNPDPYTGFSGAHRAIIPGICSLKTLEAIRIKAFENNVAPGIVEGNPILGDTFEAVNLAGNDFAINLVTNPQGGLIKAYSGNLEDSWRNALAEFGSSFNVKIEVDADVVVVSAGGIRFDFSLYQSIWSLRNIRQIVRKGTMIVLLAECSEGLGAEGFIKLAHINILNEFKRRYILGAESVHLIKNILKTNEVILVSALPKTFIEPLGLKMANTANEALKLAVEERRRKKTVLVTHGCYTLPILEREENDESQSHHRKVDKE